METELQPLIQKLQDGGVAKAKAKAQTIIEQAEKDARDLREQAQKEADALVSAARKEVAQLERTARASMKQANRDILLGTRAQIEKIFASLLEKRIEKSMSSEADAIIARVLGEWVSNPESARIEVGGDDAKTLCEALKADFAVMVSKGLEIKPLSNRAAGFTLSLDAGASYTDVRPEALVALFSARVNDEIASLISVSEEAGGAI